MTTSNAQIPCYKRVLLKLSGEALKGDEVFGISGTVIENIAHEIVQIHDHGVEIAVVVGGGNFFRGERSNSMGLARASADYMGMVATIMNGIALRDTLDRLKIDARLVSALQLQSVTEPLYRLRVIDHLKKGRVVILAAGTGSPFFTTDTGAALRAIEIGADVFLKATMVDGVYSGDPKKEKNTARYDYISYDDVITKDLKVLDITAVTLCKENRLLIKVFDITRKGNILKAVTDKNIGTSIY